MDGKMTEAVSHDAEAERQKRVYERAMASLELRKRKREAAGYAVMASLYAFEPASRGVGRMGRLVYWAQIVCIMFAGLAPNYLVWKLLLSS